MSQLVACPECKKHLQVPENLLGKKVQCPECKHTFVATAPDPDEIAQKTTASPPKSSPPKPPAWEKSKRRDEDEEDEEDRPRKKRRRDDDEEDDDDRPRRRRNRYTPHRGGMILAFGIIGLVTMPIFGIIAWVMGNNDLREIKAGRMDPEGEGMTNTGRILGMVGTILWSVSIVLGCGGYFCCMMGLFGIAANQPRQQRF